MGTEWQQEREYRRTADGITFATIRNLIPSRQELREMITGTVNMLMVYDVEKSNCWGLNNYTEKETSTATFCVDMIPMRAVERRASCIPLWLKDWLSFTPLDSVREEYEERCEMYRNRSPWYSRLEYHLRKTISKVGSKVASACCANP